MAESFIGEPQAVHCGPWSCLSSMASSLVRRSEFSGKPTGRRRFEGIMIALRTFEQALLETDWSR
jgi:hypothetical protein